MANVSILVGCPVASLSFAVRDTPLSVAVSVTSLAPVRL